MNGFLFIASCVLGLWAYIELRAWHIRNLNKLREMNGLPPKEFLSAFWFLNGRE